MQEVSFLSKPSILRWICITTHPERMHKTSEIWITSKNAWFIRTKSATLHSVSSND